MATRYWVGGTGTWNSTSTANWSATSGGAAGASAPVVGDDVIFDANSGTGSATTDATAVGRNITINTSTLSLVLGADFATANTVTLTLGALNLNSNTLTAIIFSSDNTNVRSISFGTTGKIVLTGSNASIWSCATATNMTTSGSREVRSTYTGGTGTRLIRNGQTGGALSSAVSMYIEGGTDIVDDRSFRYLDCDFTVFAGSVLNRGRVVFRNLTLSSSMTFNNSTGAGITFGYESGVNAIKTNSVTLTFPISFNGVGGAWSLFDDLSLDASSTFTLTNGTFDANNKNVTLGSFALGSGTKTLTLGSGTWTVLNNWDANTNVSGLTISASTATISMTSASSKTFAGGAKTWPTLNQGGSGALTVQQSNTFANITNTVQPATITLTSGTTQTVTTFTVSGTSGNLITLNSSSAENRATLTDSGGINSVSYVDIKDIAATGYGEWQAYTSNGNVDSGNNLGWVFAEPPPLTASEYQISLKSFTERRSF
jgi:hypothetical protein